MKLSKKNNKFILILLFYLPFNSIHSMDLTKRDTQLIESLILNDVFTFTRLYPNYIVSLKDFPFFIYSHNFRTNGRIGFLNDSCDNILRNFINILEIESCGFFYNVKVKLSYNTAITKTVQDTFTYTFFRNSTNYFFEIEGFVVSQINAIEDNVNIRKEYSKCFNRKYNPVSNLKIAYLFLTGDKNTSSIISYRLIRNKSNSNIIKHYSPIK